MDNKQKILLFVARLGFGWMFFYAGITKVINPAWSAAGYLKGAKTFSGVYAWLASAPNIAWVNFVNEWGLTIVGTLFILGLFFRYAAFSAIALMVLYYLPVLDFPKVGNNAFLIDQHILYILLISLLWFFGAGKAWGLDAKLFKQSHQNN